MARAADDDSVRRRALPAYAATMLISPLICVFAAPMLMLL